VTGVAFVNKQGGEQRQDIASSGQPIDFDPDDTTIVKVHYDLSAWSFDHRAELAQAMAEGGIPHYWDEDELVVPEVVEETVDAMFERLEAELGPFPVTLGVDEESIEYELDEWTERERSVLTAALIEAEIPHRWDGPAVRVAADAEEDVDRLLDAIEAGELGATGDGADEPPDGVLSDIFLAADRLAKDPFDANARRKIIDLDGLIDAKHPPYQLSPRVWTAAVDEVAAIVDRIVADADGEGVTDVPVGDDGHLQESSDVIGLAQALRSTVRNYV
jgi:hypothetical protein